MNKQDVYELLSKLPLPQYTEQQKAIGECIVQKLLNYNGTLSMKPLKAYIRQELKIYDSRFVDEPSLPDQEVRKVIQFIRRLPSVFGMPHEYFLIANHNGYRITNDRKDIYKFYTKTLIRYRNTTEQLLNLVEVLGVEVLKEK